MNQRSLKRKKSTDKKTEERAIQQGWESTADADYEEHVAELSKRKQKAKEWRTWLAKRRKERPIQRIQ